MHRKIVSQEGGTSIDVSVHPSRPGEAGAHHGGNDGTWCESPITASATDRVNKLRSSLVHTLCQKNHSSVRLL